MNRNDSLNPPKVLVRSGLALTDLVALPLLAFAFLTVLGTALASLGIVAGGINFILGLSWLDFFPKFPLPARIMSGLSLLAFSALLIATVLLLWHFFRAAWKQFWSWHSSAWQGTFVTLFDLSRVSGDAMVARVYKPLIALTGMVFLGLLVLSLALMFALARGPFWHAWHWFS